MVSDSSGNVLLVGSFTGTVDFGKGALTSAGGYDIFVVKVDPSGNTIWSENFGDSQDQFGRGIGTDASGNIFVSCGFAGAVDFGGGSLNSNGGPLDICLAKLDSSGNYVWAKRFGDGQLQQALGLAVDVSGNVVIDGLNFGSVNFGRGALTANGPNAALFVAKFDPNGRAVWSKLFQNTGTSNNLEVWRVAVDVSGDVLFTGAYWGSIDFGAGPLVSAGERDVFVAKLGPNGTLAWAERFGDGLDQEGMDVATDGSGNIFIIGNFDGTLNLGAGMMTANGGGDIFLGKLDGSGNGIWSQRFGDSNSANIGNPQRVAVDAFGNPAISGAVDAPGGSINFGGGALAYTGDGANANPFVAMFTGSGGYAWSYLGNNDGAANALAFDPSASPLLAGTFYVEYGPTLSFAGGILTPPGANNNVFLIKLTP